MFKLLTLFSVVFVLGNGVLADSLWTHGQTSMYTTRRAVNIGDIITVRISNQSSAVHEAGTDTSKRTGLGLDYYNLWDQYSLNADENESLRKMQDYSLGGRDVYSGLGKTSRKSQVRAVVSVIVTEVLANGNLAIAGEHAVNINDETEIIRISGIIRPQDIRPDNSILSHQIAQVQVSVKGEGVVGSKQSPGVLSKMFGWIF